MPIRPQDVYDDPDGYWEFLTTPADRDFEGQLFDRKEGRRPRPDGGVSGSDIRSLRDLSLTALMEPPMFGFMEPLTGADLGSRTG